MKTVDLSPIFPQLLANGYQLAPIDKRVKEKPYKTFLDYIDR
jgi:hypothetical protein